MLTNRSLPVRLSEAEKRMSLGLLLKMTSRNPVPMSRRTRLLKLAPPPVVSMARSCGLMPYCSSFGFTSLMIHSSLLMLVSVMSLSSTMVSTRSNTVWISPVDGLTAFPTFPMTRIALSPPWLKLGSSPATSCGLSIHVVTGLSAPYCTMSASE